VGPFCDPQIVSLSNRRFIPFAFDLSNKGGLFDPTARKAVVAVSPELGGNGVPTPDVLFMTADGKLLARVSNYASEAEFLEVMKQVLTDHPECNKASKEELAATTPLERGRVAFELNDFTTAKKELSALESDESKILLSQIARYAQDWKTAERHLSDITTDEWKDDVQMERVRMHVANSEFEKAIKLADLIHQKSNRYTEARYFKGVAQSFNGESKLALATWKELFLSQKEHDNWVYRTDWAYSQTIQKEKKLMSTTGKRVSLLGRIGYMGRSNPDLVKPKAK